MRLLVRRRWISKGRAECHLPCHEFEVVSQVETWHWRGLSSVSIGELQRLQLSGAICPNPIRRKWVEVIQIACKMIVTNPECRAGFGEGNELLIDLFACLHQ